jgi:hypothetical protein
MSMSRGRRAALALVTVCVAVTSGCGGDLASDARVVDASPPAAPAESGTNASGAEGSSTTLEEADEVVDLDSVLLTLEDMGPDWAYAAHEGVPGPSLFETFLQEGQCATPGEPALPQPEHDVDVDFSGGAGAIEADQVTSTVGRFAPSGAEGWFDGVVERITRCEDPTIVAKEVIPLEGLGDEAILIHVAVDLAPGITTARFDIGVARVADLVAVVATLTASVEALDEAQLLDTMVARF